MAASVTIVGLGIEIPLVPQPARADVRHPPLTFANSRRIAGSLWGLLGLSELEFSRGIRELSAQFDSTPSHVCRRLQVQRGVGIYSIPRSMDV